MSTPEPTSGWRTHVLKHFTEELAQTARLTIVGDPDELLLESGVMDAIEKRGFELLHFDDHVAFRYAYETRFRRHWDAGRDTSLVVVLRAPSLDLGDIPHDLLEDAKRSARLLTFSLPDVFPQLSPNVLAELRREELDGVHAACLKHKPQSLGENATRDFLLRHLFEIDLAQLKQPHDLLRLLLRRHYRGREHPTSLDQRLISLLRQEAQWNDWPLEDIIPQKTAFLDFLQERWPFYLDRVLMAAEFRIGEDQASYGLRFSGPDQLPFDHDDIRVYIDNLFIEGFLKPVRLSEPVSQSGWWWVGVAQDPIKDALTRMGKLQTLIDQQLPGSNDSLRSWQTLAWQWSELMVLKCQLGGDLPKELAEAHEQLHDKVEGAFERWMLSRYAGLHNLPYLPRPVTVDKIPHYLAHQLKSSGGTARKLALVVVDGLALDQWLLLREDIEENQGIDLEESVAFAWVLTLTSVSRQAIFSGAAPFFFASSIGTTQKEKSAWQKFWDDKGLRGPAVGYLVQKKIEDEAHFLTRVDELISHPKIRIAGFVVGKVDQGMHGVVSGTGGMHASVREWVKQGGFSKLLELLIGQGFEVYVTADHGNIEGQGIGKPNVGAMADERGERVHVFDHQPTREGVQNAYPATLQWPSVGLPENYLPLIARGRGAFISTGTRTVGHGGIALEETVVPFVHIKEKK